MLKLQADVLVIGSGMAAVWAAIGAVRDGASVILVDKGYVGTSGVTATAPSKNSTARWGYSKVYGERYRGLCMERALRQCAPAKPPP